MLAVALLLFDLYALIINPTNHTGLPVTWLLGLCLVSLGGAIAGLRAGKRPTGVANWIKWAILVISAIGVVNIVLFDTLNIMMGYENWARRGMPEKPLGYRVR